MLPALHCCWYGSRYHVANATEGFIYVKSEGDKIRVRKVAGDLKLGDEVGFGAEVNVDDKRIERGFLALDSMDYIEVTGKIISIKTEKGELVAENYELPRDRSVIVTERKTLIQSKYGFIWKDEKGEYHGIYNCGKCGQKSCSCRPKK